MPTYRVSIRRNIERNQTQSKKNTNNNSNAKSKPHSRQNAPTLSWWWVAGWNVCWLTAEQMEMATLRQKFHIKNMNYDENNVCTFVLISILPMVFGKSRLLGLFRHLWLHQFDGLCASKKRFELEHKLSSAWHINMYKHC